MPGGSQANFIGKMMARAEGEMPGVDLTVPKDLTPELHAVERAVAEMKNWHPVYHELICEVYVRGKFVHEVAAEYSPLMRKRRRWSDQKAREMITRAERVCGRFIRDQDAKLLYSRQRR